MKITAESPELTAYALGELSDADRALVEQALAADPTLQTEVDDIRQAIARLETELASESPVALSTEQREHVISQADGEPNRSPRHSPEPGVLAKFRDWCRAQQTLYAVIIAGAAACVLAGLFLPSLARAKAKKTASLSASKEDAATWRYAANKPLPPSGPTPTVGPGDRLTEGGVLMESVDSLRRLDRAPQTPPATGASGAKAKLAAGSVSANTSVVELKKEVTDTKSVDNITLGQNRQQLDASGGATAGRFGGGGGELGRSLVVEGQSTTADKQHFVPPLADAPAQPQASLHFYRETESFADNLPAETPALRTYGGADARTRFGRRAAVTGKAATTDSLGLTEQNALIAKTAPTENRPLGEEGKASRFGLSLSDDYAQTPNVGQEAEVRAKGRPLSTLAAALQPESAYREERYPQLVANNFEDVRATPLSTFGLDVDTASYANVRRFLREGVRPPVAAVRVEEMVNYFPYSYPAPQEGKPFGVQVETAECPWNQAHRLVRIAIKARETERVEMPGANLVFLIDVSGSMNHENKLPLVKRSLHLVLEKLGERDKVGVVTYAGEAKVAMEPTAVTAEGRQSLLSAIDGLHAGSGTHGSAGIQQAYAMATNKFITGGINRVILCTDGDFNIGITSREELLGLITTQARTGVFLSVLGYGMDNYKDSTMELLADRGNGNYAYIDSFREAQKVLKQQLQSTLITIAKDVKAQVEFNPDRVVSWRQIGYEKRRLADRDFNDDTKDAGEIGAGHTVTVLYELVPAAGHQPGVDPLRYAAGTKFTATKETGAHGDELLYIRLRYKEPESAKSKLIEIPVKDRDESWQTASADFKFATAVAGFGELLRGSLHKGDLTWERVLQLGEQGLGDDREGYRAEFIDLVRSAQKIIGEQ
ncbi:MAG TPA: von Willebrand factor type A domain-containing protein [Candidatus Limnocylindria bacterium]|jgi:secreted protein with Ig-like and vWFA domain|nr:von Willebrand factor type A domain-containing protein [Candidatus Limnocylindria bacterium]